MIRILHVFGQLEMGGAEYRTIEMYEELRKYDIIFDFVVTKPGEHYFSRIVKKMGSEVYFIPSIKKNGMLKYSTKLYKLIRSKNYTAVHSHTAFNSGINLLISFFARVPIRISHSRSAPVSKKASLFRIFYEKIMRILLIIFATKLVYCGEEARKYLYGKRKWRFKKNIYIPNSINVKRYLDIKCDEYFSEQFVIIQIGSFRDVKNHIFTVQIIEELALEFTDMFKVLFVGEGQNMAFIKKTLRDKNLNDYCNFLGLRDDIPNILACSDLMILPSLYEGIPGVVLEAQAAGLKTIISNTIDEEVIIDKDLVTKLPLNRSVWVNQLSNLIKSGKIQKKTDREIAKTVFNIDLAIIKYRSLYERG